LTSRSETSCDRKLPITAVVLTFNEHRNLPACLESIEGRVAEIVVVDSFSSDDTREIAARYGARCLSRKFINQAEQLQWALDNAQLKTEWVVRVDADERWTEEGFEALASVLGDDGVAGVNVRMRIYFMGRFLRHGGLYPNLFLRVFRRAGARVEQRWMDEHIQVTGRVVSPAIDVTEANYDRQQNIGLWTTKHNGYSTREAVDVLVRRHGLGRIDSVADLHGGRTERKRWLKEHLYARAPLLVRPFLYFVYRYVFQLGFLDGRPGLIFHVLHAFWYRFLVDVKVQQLEELARNSGRSLPQVIHDSYGIDV
jgi:glycosyltransferase involved in cell wall biosynthesis